MTMNYTAATFSEATIMAWFRVGSARPTAVLAISAVLTALAAPSLAFAETPAQSRPAEQTAANEVSAGDSIDQRVVEPALDPDYTDPLRTAKRLARDGGIPLAQASAHSAAIHGVVSVHVQSLKNYLTDMMEGMEARLETKIEGVEARLETRIEGVEAKMDAKMEGMGARIGIIEGRLDFLIFTVLAGLIAVFTGGYYFSRRLPSPQPALEPAQAAASSVGGLSSTRWTRKRPTTSASLMASNEESVEEGGKV